MPTSEPPSLAQQWARKYVENLSSTRTETTAHKTNLKSEAANRLLDVLRHLSLKAWSQTEEMLAEEIQRHGIDRHLVNPWEISQDAFKIYEKVLEFYTQNTEYNRLPALIAPDIDKIRKKYTQKDPRVIAFVSVQFHYTGRLLQGHLSSLEQSLLGDCFSVIDDHLYMPLHRAYSAAGKYEPNSSVLVIVREVLGFSTEVADRITQEIAHMYPNYKTYSGSLKDDVVMVSSRRDVVMFQIYLVVSVLEKSPSILQNELFPLCVMLYPKLKVHWEFVRQMLLLIADEIQERLGQEALALFESHLGVLRDMFSPEVFFAE